MKLGNVINEFKGGIGKISGTKKNLLWIPIISTLLHTNISAKSLSGECYGGYGTVSRVYNLTNQSDTLIDSVGIDHGLDFAWGVHTEESAYPDKWENGEIVNIDILDSLGNAETRTKHVLDFSGTYLRDMAPTTFYGGHSVYGDIYRYISPDSTDTVLAYGSVAKASVPGKGSIPLPVDIRENKGDDYHGDISLIPGIAEGDSIDIIARKEKNGKIYGDSVRVAYKKTWEPPVYRIDATRIDLHLKPIDTVSVEEKNLEKMIGNTEIYPVPSNSVLYIKNKPENSKVKVYNAVGEFVNDIKEKGEWDFRDKMGRKVMNGIYFLQFTDDKGDKRTEKAIYIR